MTKLPFKRGDVLEVVSTHSDSWASRIGSIVIVTATHDNEPKMEFDFIIDADPRLGPWGAISGWERFRLITYIELAALDVSDKV